MMKFAWRNNISDLAAWNSSHIEVIEGEIRQYEDMLVADWELKQ